MTQRAGNLHPRSFEVLALPEPRMNADQLQQTVADVGTGIGNVLSPVTDAGLISSGADAALFNQEMAKLNAAWGIIGERIAALPPEDAALLTHLLDNSGALEILEGLGQSRLERVEGGGGQSFSEASCVVSDGCGEFFAGQCQCRARSGGCDCGFGAGWTTCGRNDRGHQYSARCGANSD